MPNDSNRPGYHNRHSCIVAKISSLLVSLAQEPSRSREETAQTLEYWIGYVLTEQFTTVDELVEGVSYIAWEGGNPYVVASFLKEFRNVPCRSEHATSFVDQLCQRVLRWFSIAAAEDHYMGWSNSSVASGGGDGFVRAALFVGHLIECSLLSHDLVRRHLIKPLVIHRSHNYYRANAVYQLFVTAGSTLLQGLLGANDVQVSFQILDTSVGLIDGLDKEKLQVRPILRLNAS